jgi:hypothetical protein
MNLLHLPSSTPSVLPHTRTPGGLSGPHSYTTPNPMFLFLSTRPHIYPFFPPTPLPLPNRLTSSNLPALDATDCPDTIPIVELPGMLRSNGEAA